MNKMNNRFCFYWELSETAKKIAVAEFQAWYDEAVFDNEKKADWKTEHFAKQWFDGYGYVFNENGTRA